MPEILGKKEELKASKLEGRSKLSLLEDDICYIYKFQEGQSKTIRCREFSKAAGVKINKYIHKSTAFLYISKEASEIEIKKRNLLAITSKEQLHRNKFNKRSARLVH